MNKLIYRGSSGDKNVHYRKTEQCLFLDVREIIKNYSKKK